LRHALALLAWIHKKRVEEKFDILAVGKGEDGKDRVIEPIFTFLPSSK